jgi:hypothetical protein
VPVAAVPSVYHALMAKSPCLARVPSEGAGLLPYFCRALGEVAPLLGACVAVLAWDREDVELTRALAAEAEAVTAYGSDATLAAVRSLTPPGARFIGYGHRVGFGVIGREALALAAVGETARRAAFDVAAFDQQGCMSPHWFWVETGGAVAPEAFGEFLADAVAHLRAELPRRPLSPAEASAVHQLRAAWIVRPDARVLAGNGTEWTVIYTPDPVPEFSCLNRTVFVKPVPDAVTGLPDLIPLAGHLQTVTCALRPTRLARLAEQLGRAGVTRLCPLGRAQLPAPAYHHDGRAALRDLLRWVDVERS